MSSARCARTEVFAGFRGDAVSFYFDQSTVLQFTSDGELRRAHIRDELLKAEQGRLVAMGGERMRIPRHQEISTVCTLPELARAGYASRIIMALARHAALRGDQIFAHCVRGNDAIFALQHKLGEAPRAIIPMTGVVRLR